LEEHVEAVVGEGFAELVGGCAEWVDGCAVAVAVFAVVEEPAVGGSWSDVNMSSVDHAVVVAEEQQVEEVGESAVAFSEGSSLGS